MKIPVIKNTFTGYIKMAVFLLEGIFVSRWIIQYLGMEQYGLWALLWSLFGYTLLLDGGCGLAAQKYTAGGLYIKNPLEYSRIISTIFTFHSVMALVIAGVTVAGGFFLPQLLDITDPEKLQQARICFFLFGFGSALLFPTGLFPEILIGLQKIYLRNSITVCSKIAELAGVIIIFLLGGKLITLIAFIMFSTLAENLITAFFAFKNIPGFKLRFYSDRQHWREIISFSGYVYLGILSNLLLTRTSRILISIFCGMTSVGLFQISSKLADLCSKLVTQYQENIAPITGSLHKRGKFLALGRIVFGAMRWNAFTATAVMLPSFFLATPLLLVLFKVESPDITALSRLFLVSLYLTIVYRSVPQKYFVMSDQHRFSNWILLGEALATVVLNILLLKTFGIVVVLYVAIGLKLFISFVFFMPLLLKRLHLNAWLFVRKIGIEPLLAGIPAMLWLQGFSYLAPAATPWVKIIVAGGIAGVLYGFAMLVFCPLPRKIRKFIPPMLCRLCRISGGRLD